MREHVRGVLLSAGVGIGIVYLITVDDPEGFRFGMATYGAMIGGFAYPLCAWLTWILRGWLASTRMPAWLARAILYFFGGVAARRAHVLTVLVVSQAVGLAGAAIWVLASADPLPAAADLLPALGAGLCGAVGLAALYRGMAVGAMGIVAPISAASPVVPLLVDLGRGVRPAALQWLGIAVVLGGIVLLAREPGGAARRSATSAWTMTSPFSTDGSTVSRWMSTGTEML